MCVFVFSAYVSHMYTDVMKVVLLTFRILYVVTHSHIINQYQMDGQGDVIKTYSESEDYQISAMTIDYDNNQLYFKVDSEDDNPYALSRINYDFTGLLRTVLDLRETNFLYGHPLPPFAVHDESLYLISRRQDSGPRGLLFFSTGGNLLCLNTQINTPVYSTKIMHYGRQPGKYANTYLHNVITYDIVHCVVQDFTGARLTMVTVMHYVYHKSLDGTVSVLHTKFTMPT